MLTKDFLDELFLACNGALTRPELLRKVNHYQNWLFSRNCTEMEDRRNFTVATAVESPEFAPLITLTKVGVVLAENTDYEVGDTFLFTNQGFRVVVAGNSGTGTAFLLDNCSPITSAEWGKSLAGAVNYGEGLMASDAALYYHEGQYFFRWLTFPDFEFTGDFAADAVAAELAPISASPEIIGTVATYSTVIPEYVELAGLREVVTVGIRASDGSWREIYPCRIDQSADPTLPVRIYTADLPEDTELEAMGYRWPTQVSSPTIQLEVPMLHQEGVLRALVLKSVEEANYGQSVYWKNEAERLFADWYNYINRSKTAPPQRPKTIRYNGLAG